MDYDIGKIGRVVVARGHDGEDVYTGIEGIAAAENVRSAAVIAVGGLRRGKVVVGPEDPDAEKLSPIMREFDDAREIAGVGTIFSDDEGPKLHLHGAIGRGDETLAGCPRGGADVFCVLEIIIIELLDVQATRTIDPQYALKLLTLAAGKSV